MTPTMERDTAEETSRQQEIRAAVESLDSEIRELAERREAVRNEAGEAVAEPFRRFREVDDQIRRLLDRRTEYWQDYHEQSPPQRSVTIGDILVDSDEDYRVIDTWRGYLALQRHHSNDVLIARPEHVESGELYFPGPQLGDPPAQAEIISVEEDRSREDLMPF